MTENEWQEETGRPQMMVSHLREWKPRRTKAGKRKFRLFACGCCRLAWDTLPNDSLREAVEAAERYAEGLATKEELVAAHTTVQPMRDDSGPFGTASPEVRVAIDMVSAVTHPNAFEAAFCMTAGEPLLAGQIRRAEAAAYLCQLFRCVVGNPFRPVALNRVWRTTNAVSLAQAIYDQRAFDRLPILADALEDAGCVNTDILKHCRLAGVHVRGCWVVDLVLNKE
jgi:hypothetical protein